MWLFIVFFFKQKTAYEMRISDWSSDVCSSDLKYADTVDVMAFEEVAGYAEILQHFHRSPAQEAAAQRIAASRLSFNDNGFNARIQQVHRSRRARGTAADDQRIRSTHSRKGK